MATHSMLQAALAEHQDGGDARDSVTDSANNAALRCLALVGPTAAGKTAAAMAIAQALPVEVISVDSALVYRGMDIGTAKPSAQERARVAHHLIDIRDPAQPYSAAEFARDATRLVDEINARGNLALLIGGTMLYLRALMQGLDDMPAADPVVRAAIEQEAAQVGWPAMHARLALVDPASAQRLQPRDAQRIQRALEVHRLTGRPISSLHAKGATRAAASPFSAMPVLSLEPSDRAWLHARIAQRFEAMLAGGLLDEVRSLRARGDLHADLPSMRCVGYRQAWEALDGRWPMAELRDRGVFATRQLAKRQITWLRSMPQREVFAAEAPDAIAQLVARARRTAAAA
ncbi:MAG: tRNA (adenosine(37)-N6)-dimethylallyltransferase MiaA [Burkholderiaceae bacterium]